jgi:hypothetical protein
VVRNGPAQLTKHLTCTKTTHSGASILVRESEIRLNKSRNGCVHSCRLFCPHAINSSYINTKGRYLPHRNMEKFGIVCGCPGMDCYTEKTEEL